MTVNELLAMVDRLHPNQFSTEDKLRWLNEVEQTIYREIVCTHEYDGELPEMPDYTEASDDELLAVAPYDRLYPLWMDAKIAYYNRESLKYQDAYTAFNAAYVLYANWYNRTHMPCGAVNHLHLLDRTWGWD